MVHNRVVVRLAALIAGIAILASCGAADDSAAAEEGSEPAPVVTAENPPLAVEAMEVSRGSIIGALQASGIVRGTNEATIISEAQGRIEAVNLTLGEFVAEGTPLVTIDSTLARLTLAEARQLQESAALDLAATQRRFNAGSASQAELSRSQSAANGAAARLEQAQKAFDDHTVRAPISGFVATVGDGVSRGNVMQRGAVVARVVDLSAFRMQVSVGEQVLPYLEVGAPAAVSIGICGTDVYPGRVASIAAGSDSRTGSFPVVVEWDAACDDVRSGVGASVIIQPAIAEDPIVIPSGALRADASGTYVYLADGATSIRRPIQVAERFGDRIAVSSGLELGELLVVSGLSSLRDGAPVVPTVIGLSGGSL